MKKQTNKQTNNTTTKKKSMLEDTLIIFTTDNGGPIPCHICDDNTGSSNYPLRGGKNSLWEGGVRGTAFVYGPNFLEKSSYTYDGLVHMSDFHASILSFASLPHSGLDGFDVLPMISSNLPSPRTEILLNIDPLHSIEGPYSSNATGNAALIYQNWKILVGHPGPPDGYSPSYNSTIDSQKAHEKTQQTPQPIPADIFGHPQHNTTVLLFDLETDPTESHNLAHDYPEVVKFLLERLAFYNASAVPPNFPKRADPAANPARWNFTWTPWQFTVVDSSTTPVRSHVTQAN